MSTAPTPGTPQAPVAPVVEVAPDLPREIRIISHCTLFYWWPVWAIGFIMALITFLTNERMVTVPKKSEYYGKTNITLVDGKVLTDRGAWVLPENKTETHQEVLRIS